MTAVLYTITRRETGDQYVGITEQLPALRWSQHKYKARNGLQTHLCHAMRKHGEQAFSFDAVCTFPTRELAVLAEMTSIAFAQPRYNISAGGEGAAGVTASPQARAKMSAAQRGNQHSLGRKVSAETRAKLSAAKAGVTKSETHRAAIGAAHVGMKRSPEARARMSAAQKQSHARRQASKMSAQKAG